MRKIASASFALFAGLPLAWAAGPANAATVENLTYPIGDIRILIPRIETTGGRMSDADLRMVTDPAGTDTLAQRLAKLDASSISIPQLRVDLVKGAPQTLLTYRDVTMKGVANGVIDDVSVATGVADITDPKGTEVKATYGAMSLHKLNLGLLLRIFTSQRSDPNEPLQTIYEDLSADGVSMTSDEIDMSMGRMSGSGIKARPFAMPISEMISLVQGLNGKTPDPEQSRQLIAFVSDVLQSTEFGKGEARDIKMNIKKGGPGVFGIGRIYMSSIGGARIGEIGYENIAFDMPDGKFSLGRFAMSDLDMSHMLATLLEAARSGDMDMNARNPRDLVPTLGKIEIAGIDADVSDKTGKGNSDDGKRILLHLGRFELGLRNYLDGIPTAVRLTLQDFSMPLPKETKDRDLRKVIELGIKRIDVSSSLDISFDEAKQELGINSYSFNMPGLGDLKISGTIGNVAKDLFSRNVALVEATALGAVAKNLEVRFSNLGIVEKALAMQAKQAGQTPEQVKQMVVAGAAIGIPMMLGDSNASKVVSAAIAKFLADPKNLRVRARAPNGLGIADVQAVSDPKQLLQKLDVDAAANE